MQKGGKMDVDYYWASRIHSAKHLSALQSAKHIGSENHLILEDDSEANEDARTYFTCPFCYVDTELSHLCTHLQEEHCFDVKDAICPVCAMNLGKDVVSHFRVHHAHSLKNQRKCQRSTFWSSNIRELSSFYGLTAKGGLGYSQDSSPDPLLAPFLCNVPYSDLQTNQLQDTTSCDEVSTTLETEVSTKSVTSEVKGEKVSEERMRRAQFLQELMFSTMV